MSNSASTIQIGFSSLKSVQIETQLLVFGFIRHIEINDTLFMIIPPLVSCLTLLFFNGHISNYRLSKPFNTYIIQVLKKLYSTLDISSQAVSDLNIFCYDMIDRLSIKASCLASYSNINISHLITATELVLNAELTTHAISEGVKCFAKYNDENTDSLLPPYNNQNIQIFIKTMTSNETIKLNVFGNDTIKIVTDKLLEQTSTIPINYVLYFDGKHLQEDKTVSEYGIHNLSILRVVMNSRNDVCDMVFPHEIIQTYLNEDYYACKHGINLNEKNSLIYLTSVVEYLIAEILELSGNAATKNGKQKINLMHVYLAIRNDAELYKLCCDADVELCYRWMDWECVAENENSLVMKSKYVNISNEEIRYLNASQNEQKENFNVIIGAQINHCNMPHLNMPYCSKSILKNASHL
eukprot:64086_1